MSAAAKRIAYVTGGMGGIRNRHLPAPSQGRVHRDRRLWTRPARKDRWPAEMRGTGCDVHASDGNVSDWDSTKARL